MYNYEHETKEIKDRYLKNYIFYDYFHDSLIKNIYIQDEGKLVQLELSCEREWPSHDWSRYANDIDYIYKLNFINCAYVEYQRSDFGTYTEYLNGRFKKSSKLIEINQETRRKNYHLRIQLADGYMDLIFQKFIIEKMNGHIHLPKRIPLEWHFDLIKRKFTREKIDEIRKTASTGDFPKKSYALEYLWVLNDESTFELATNALLDEDACIPAVFILGELGNIKSLNRLTQILNKENNSIIFKRHIKDAIEKLIMKR